ncbi:L,D-transpeptidase family protein [Novosphingobium sp. TH158]|uniref:L,D-transpeptidase family protein n=1 Tax=Novosphingobium sp. TH158 TaxID=2067455 RepID=UPI000C7D9426|nr:L,D-transpeptidase family protein [Novosphingobium sp. TH158]PLK26978.1 L,D-transpeptidase [Novosphingobium sp. TH158]
MAGRGGKSGKRKAAPRWRRLDARHLAPFAVLLLAADHLEPSDPANPPWSDEQVAQLLHIAATAPEDGLLRPDTTALENAIRRDRPGAIAREANGLALGLARQHLLGAAPASERVEWYIVDTDKTEGLPQAIAAALAENRLPALFDSLRPSHPDYRALRAALGNERDPARQAALVRTMDRWRWLPNDLGDDFIMANAAGFEVKLWRRGEQVKRWAAISGKSSTPTPSLMAEATAVNFNPWWEVPASIAKESGMRAGGRYVWSGKHFRQPPGPSNALGRVKVIMPNSHNIYLHDTPSRGLFGAEQRAFSHGCLRVEDALGFAHTLLDGTMSRAEIDKLFEPPKPAPGGAALATSSAPPQPKSTVVHLPVRIPVYVTYMTVTVRSDGSLAYHRDIYGRDARLASLVPGLSRPQLALQ